jgi:hypothetical protein
MKLLVCGGRDFNDTPFAYDQIQRLNPSAIIHGKARGADSIAGLYAKEFGIPCIEVPANWDFYGKRAGFLRNKWMIDFCSPDHVLALPGGNGTANMVELSHEAGIKVMEWKIG